MAEVRLTSSPEPGIFMPTTYTMFFITTLTPRRCLRPIDVNCLIVFARRVFFSFARFTLSSAQPIFNLMTKRRTPPSPPAGTRPPWHHTVSCNPGTANPSSRACCSRTGISVIS